MGENDIFIYLFISHIIHLIFHDNYHVISVGKFCVGYKNFVSTCFKYHSRLIWQKITIVSHIYLY